MAQLMNEGAVNLGSHFAPVAAARQDIAPVKDDLMGPGAAGGLPPQGNAAEQTQKCAIVCQVHLTTHHFIGSVLDDDGHLVKINTKLRGDGIDSVADKVVKFVVGEVQLKVSPKLSESMGPQFKGIEQTIKLKRLAMIQSRQPSNSYLKNAIDEILH